MPSDSDREAEPQAHVACADAGIWAAPRSCLPDSSVVPSHYELQAERFAPYCPAPNRPRPSAIHCR